MKKTILSLSILFALIFGVYFFFKKADLSEPAMDFPEKLETDGCLGLTFHRIRKERFFYKVIGYVTNSEELMKYNVYRDQFASQIKLLKKRGAYFATPKEILEFQASGTFPEKCVWISFDDIDQTVYTNAFPILKENKIPFTLFVIAGTVGRDFSNLTMATWQELQEMVDSGLVTVGSHTFDMHRLQDNQPIFFGDVQGFKEDLLASKKTLERKLSVPVTDFAYPYGNGRNDLAGAIQEAGVKTAAILAPHSITAKNDRYWWNRILVNQSVFDDVVVSWVK